MSRARFHLAFMLSLVLILTGEFVWARADEPTPIPFEGPPGVSAQFTLIGAKWTRPVTHSCDAMTNTAIAQWVAVSGLQDGGCGTDITVSVVPDASIYPAAGLTGWSQSGGIFQHVNISIAQTYALNPKVFLHEAGHAVGMGHSCESVVNCAPLQLNAIMFYSLSGQNHLNEDDIAGIQSLYGPPAGPIPTPTPPIHETPTATLTPTATATPQFCVGLACITRTPVPTPPPFVRRAFFPSLAGDH